MRTSWAHKGFSLVELLTVIAIIALIISIVLPVLGGAREAGRKVSTQGLLNDISGAASQFKLDHQGRNPGYFSSREMGSQENYDRGMSEMENVLLELAGTGAIMETASASTVEVGPIANQTIHVDPGLLGTKDAYFNPSGEFYAPQLAGQQVSTVPGHAGNSDTDIQLFDMIDAFGQPLLFWSADTDGVPSVTQPDEFAQKQAGNPPALFYWNTNAAFLRSTNLGRKGLDQAQTPAPGVTTSLIGGGADDAKAMLSMQALLGSPSAPRSGIPGQTVEDLLGSPSETNIEALYPGRSKGAFLIHSAGSDGIYLSSNDRGFRSVAHEDDHIDFGLNFFTGPTGRVTDDEGNNTSRDIISEFDDIVVSGGG